MIPNSSRIVVFLLRGNFGILNVRIREKLFLTYLFHFLLAFQLHQFHCNPISDHKVMIQTVRHVQNPNLNLIRF